ncbi:MAG TPA: MFS transporter [Stackebrandtia sp.]|jgi:MFS family permease|uniref:MFS transporter n=1 Tax=Stackebrandtia sp. TaxID=2023065 RepID=UPI002D459A1D|nr:MFS transporter [Stackebrandtia sp.]HZE38785.1 MFS transporter [Stackebrandtia sp.]
MTVPPVPQGKPRKAALAAWIGSALEYYDFFIYGTAAALVFGGIFFPTSDPSTETLLALATFGVGYVARPVGAFFLGHLGDTFGRKKVLVLTIVMMGTSTFLVGCLPGYATIGVTAPILLVALRLLQGLSAAGEQAGANSMSLEHSPDDARAFFTSFTLSGTQAGQILATAVFLPVAALPRESLMSWGWRIPFWLSAIVAIAGLVIRRTLEETPVFVREAARDEIPKLPLWELLRNHWADVLRVIAAALVASVSTIFTVYALSYAVNTVKLDKSAILWVGVLANIVALAAIPLFAKLSDRIGRRPVFLIGTVGSAVLMFGYLWAISTGDYVLIFGLGIAMFGVIYSAANGIWPALYGEMFSAKVRLSGMAIGTQFGFAISAFAPSLADLIAGRGVGGWLLPSLLVAGACLISAVAVALSRETYRVPTGDLGVRPARVPRNAAPL